MSTNSSGGALDGAVSLMEVTPVAETRRDATAKIALHLVCPCRLAAVHSTPRNFAKCEQDHKQAGTRVAAGAGLALQPMAKRRTSCGLERMRRRVATVAGTVEEKIQALQVRKSDLARAVLEGGTSQRVKLDESQQAELFSTLGLTFPRFFPNYARSVLPPLPACGERAGVRGA
jgi:hypothetical protein